MMASDEVWSLVFVKEGWRSMFLLWWSIKQNLLQSKEILVGGKEEKYF